MRHEYDIYSEVIINQTLLKSWYKIGPKFGKIWHIKRIIKDIYMK